jgi:hypothetical protein
MAAPVFHIVFVLPSLAPALGAARRPVALDSADSSPPDDDHAVRGSSPRSPPVLLA